jgi:hypothetical protein
MLTTVRFGSDVCDELGAWGVEGLVGDSRDHGADKEAPNTRLLADYQADEYPDNQVRDEAISVGRLLGTHRLNPALCRRHNEVARPCRSACSRP